MATTAPATDIVSVPRPILTVMFDAAGGSLLVAFLFHAQMNGPAWPDAQPWDMVGLVLLALVVVWPKRATVLRTGSGCTDVLLADGPSTHPQQPDTTGAADAPMVSDARRSASGQGAGDRS